MIIKNGILKKVDNSEIVNGTIIIPEGVTQIGDKAFYGCEKLTDIKLPRNFTKKLKEELDNSGINSETGRKVLFGAGLDEIEKIKAKAYFQTC